MKRSTSDGDGIDGGRSAHRLMRRLNCLAALKIAALGIALTASAPRASAQTAVEQLTCGDSTMPRATYRRAKLPVRADSLSDVLVVVEDSPHRRIVPAEVQTWGMGSGTGQPGDSTGVTAIRDRHPLFRHFASFAATTSRSDSTIRRVQIAAREKGDQAPSADVDLNRSAPDPYCIW